MKRGDVVIVAGPGDYGKPRPAIVIQSDRFLTSHASVTVCPLTTTKIDSPLFRLDLEPSRENGLQHFSQIMIDKTMTVPSKRIGKHVGSLDDDAMLRLNRSLAVWLGLGD